MKNIFNNNLLDRREYTNYRYYRIVIVIDVAATDRVGWPGM